MTRKQLTKAQKRDMQPYLPKLIKRYKAVARHGETKLRDPLCVAAEYDCGKCPVFARAYKLNKFRDLPCLSALAFDCPGYDTGADIRQGSASLEDMKAWGAKTVARVEGMRD